jgi:hypothetical protein
MRSALTALALSCAALVSGCATSPVVPGGGLPLGKSGWEFNGGIDWGKGVYFVYFSRPFGAKEKAIADGFGK